MTLLAAFKMLLHSFTRQEDVCIATLVANRNRWETEPLIGLFANTVLLRTDLSGNPTYQEVLQRVRATTLAAYEHQDLFFEDLVHALEHEHALERQSLCQAMFILQNTMFQTEGASTRRLKFFEFDRGPDMPELDLTTLDIILVLRERPHGRGLAGTCIYKTDRFEATTVQHLLNHFKAVLKHVVGQPEQSLSTLPALWTSRDRET